jgi:hypothetical protein
LWLKGKFPIGVRLGFNLRTTGAGPFTSFLLTYLNANIRDHDDGVAQINLALHSAWDVCVCLLSGGHNVFIFYFCLRAISFLWAMNVFIVF